jgi:hypothetical protein
VKFFFWKIVEVVVDPAFVRTRFGFKNNKRLMKDWKFEKTSKKNRNIFNTEIMLQFWHFDAVDKRSSSGIHETDSSSFELPYYNPSPKPPAVVVTVSRLDGWASAALGEGVDAVAAAAAAAAARAGWQFAATCLHLLFRIAHQILIDSVLPHCAFIAAHRAPW